MGSCSTGVGNLNIEEICNLFKDHKEQKLNNEEKFKILVTVRDFILNRKAKIEAGLDDLEKNCVGKLLLLGISERKGSIKKIKICAGLESKFEDPDSKNLSGITVKNPLIKVGFGGVKPVIYNVSPDYCKGFLAGINVKPLFLNKCTHSALERPISVTLYHEMLHYFHYIDDRKKGKKNGTPKGTGPYHEGLKYLFEFDGIDPSKEREKNELNRCYFGEENENYYNCLDLWTRNNAL
jgi:hypothetical protein